jgi:cobalt transporter subunit CbtB
MRENSNATTLPRSVDTTRGLVPVLAAALLGTFLIVGAGFVQIPAVHNAAHDSRHAFAFPCH